MSKRALFILAVALAASAALPAHAGNVDHVFGTANKLTGYDTVHFEDDWRSHPFEVSITLDATLLGAARALGPVPAIGTMKVVVALDGVEETADTRVWQGGTATDEQGRQVIIVHAIATDGCQYDLTLWGLSNPLVQIDRGGAACPTFPAHIDATGPSSFGFQEVL